MAYKGSYYYDDDYDYQGDEDFQYIYDDNISISDLNQVLGCGFMVLKQIIKQFFYLFAINLAYRVIRQTGLFLI